MERVIAYPFGWHMHKCVFTWFGHFGRDVERGALRSSILWVQCGGTEVVEEV